MRILAPSLFVTLLLTSCSGDDKSAADAGVVLDACIPASEEICGNDLDDTCEGEVDEGCPVPGSHLWATALGGPSGEDKVTALSSTDDGGVVALLVHDGDATFGLGEANETTVTAPHPFQQVLSAARYDSVGQLVWARRMVLNNGIQDDLLSSALAISSSGSILIAGVFEGEVSVAPDHASTTTLGPTDGRSAFVASIANDGRLNWAQEIVGAAFMPGQVAELSDGRVAIAGTGLQGFTFDPGGPAERTVPPTVDFDDQSFVAWYGADGSFQDVAVVGDFVGLDLRVTAGADGKTWLAGSGRVTVSSGGDTEAMSTPGLYLCEFDSDYGISRFAQIAEGAQVRLRGFDRGSDEALYLVGSYRGSTLFFPDQAAEQQEQGVLNDLFVTRIGGDLVPSWIRTMSVEAPGIDGQAIAADPHTPGGAVVGGYFGRETTFGEGEAAETTLGLDGIRALFVARYDHDGELRWVRTARNLGSYNMSSAVAVSENGSIFAAGQIGSATTFGEGEAISTTLQVQHTAQGFLAAYER